MYKYLLTILVGLIFNASFAQKINNYPTAPKDASVDVYFDTIINDPYQWMENPNDPRLEEWLGTQEKLKKKESHKHTKVWTLKSQFNKLYWKVDSETLDDYVKKNSKLKSKYVFKYDYNGFNRSPNLLYKLRGEDGNYMTLVNSKKLRHGKDDNVLIAGREVNEEEDIAAIEISHNGSDWREVFFFDLITGEQLSDTLKYLRIGSSLTWHGKNAYYTRYDKPKKGRLLLDKATGQKLCYHKIGTSQSMDMVLYQNPDTTGYTYFRFFEMDDKLFFYHYFKHKGKILRVLSVDNFIPEYFYMKNFLIYPNNDSINLSIEALFGDTLVIKSNWGAPNGRVLFANINQLNKIDEIIPEYDMILNNVNRLGKDKIACIYTKNGSDIVLIFNMEGKLLKKINFPEGKKVNYFYENDEDAEYTDFCISSFYHPDIWYQLSLKTLKYKPSESVSIPYDHTTIETRYVEYPSKDGTLIPMYITCLKNTKLNGKNPTLLYGYGGYGITVEPKFNESRLVWLLHGGILAIPRVRGGGAKGSNWAKEGRRLKKQNTIDDFIAAAEYLINEKYTNPDKLAVAGGSHGGLLVGAAITQQPELFKAAIIEAGVLDLLRFEKFTIGSSVTSVNEFGTTTSSEDFINMVSYSPLHNIKKGVSYPSVLLFTGDNDDRVPPFHTYKFLATLQEKGDPKSLYLLYLVNGAAHGGAFTSDDFYDKLLFKYYFLFDQLDLRFY